MKSLVAFLRFLFAAAGVLGGLGAALAGIGALGGGFSLRLDILAHFAPLWAAAGLAAAICGLIGGSRAAVLLGLAGLAASLWLIVPEALAAARHPRGAIDDPTLRIVEFNLWGRNRDQDATADWILRQNADILVLEEAFGGTEPIMARLRERYPYETRCRHNPCSSVIMSRRPPSATGGVDPHPGHPRLAAAWATFPGENGPFTVVGAHLTWPIPAGPQAAQVDELAGVLRRFPAERLIVAGDFNTAPWSHAMRRQDRLFGIPRHSRALPTWPAARFTRWNVRFPFPVLPIDHVYAGPGWTEARVVRGPRLGSDHYPLVITLKDRAP